MGKDPETREKLQGRHFLRAGPASEDRLYTKGTLDKIPSACRTMQRMELGGSPRVPGWLQAPGSGNSEDAARDSQSEADQVVPGAVCTGIRASSTPSFMSIWP